MTNWDSHTLDRRLALGATTPVRVVRRSSFAVSQHLESGEDLGETDRIRGGPLAAVWMQVADPAAVGAGDLGWRSGGQDAKDLVQVSVEISHAGYPFSNARRQAADAGDLGAPK